VNSKGRYGMRYQCKTCGRETLGLSNAMNMHRTDCPRWIAAEVADRGSRWRAAAPYLATLGSNLAIAGALWKAYLQGTRS